MHLKELVIRVPPPPESTELNFPEPFCTDIHLFDKPVERMRSGSERSFDGAADGSRRSRSGLNDYKRELTKEEIEAVTDLGATYLAFDRLRKAGRDLVWTYVARNLSRPLWLSFAIGWANVVVGNPPWVSFRHMSPDLQKRFRDMSKGERVYVGAKFATQNDFAGCLPCARCRSICAPAAGSPSSCHWRRSRVASSRNFAGLVLQCAYCLGRSVDDGRQRAAAVSGAVLRRVRPPPRNREAFPNGESLFRQLPFRDAHEAMPTTADGTKMHRNPPKVNSPAARPTAVVPARCHAWSSHAVSCGAQGWAARQRSDRPVCRQSAQRSGKTTVEVPAGVEHRVEAQFLHPVLLGESILPFREFRPFEGVVPVTAQGAILDAEAAANRGYAGLHGWMSAAELILELQRRKRLDEAH